MRKQPNLLNYKGLNPSHAGPPPSICKPGNDVSPDDNTAEEVARFLDFARVEKGLASNSLAAYRRDLLKFADFLRRQRKALDKVGREDIRAFLAQLFRSGLAARSVARHLVSLRNLFRFLRNEGRIPADPTAEVGAPKLGIDLPHYLSPEEMDKLLEAPDPSTPAGLRDKAMLELLYATGMRVSELVSLLVEDLDSNLGIVRCRGKSGKERLIPVGKSALRAVESYIQRGRGSFLKKPGVPHLFLNNRGRNLSRMGFWKILRRCGRQADGATAEDRVRVCAPC